MHMFFSKFWEREGLQTPTALIVAIILLFLYEKNNYKMYKKKSLITIFSNISAR